MINIRSFFRSEFIKNSATLLSANAVSQLVAFLLIPVIARIYSPEELGTLNLFLSVGSVLAILANGKYEFAIILAGDRGRSKAVFDLCLIINLLFSLFLLVVLLCGQSFILNLFHYESLEGVVYYLPFFVFITAFAQACTYWFNSNKQFGLTARYTLGQSVLNSCFKIGTGILHFGLAGLVLSNVLSHVLAVGSCLPGKTGDMQWLRSGKKQLLSVARQFSNFPKYTLPHSFINILASNLPVLLLSIYFDMAEIGFFSMALTLAFRPVNLLCSSLNQVLSQRIAEKMNCNASLWSVLWQFSSKMFLLAFPAFILIGLTTPWLISFFLGKEWELTVVYIQILLPWIFVSLFAASFSFIPCVFGKQKMAMLIEFLLIILRFFALCAGVYLNNFILSILLFSIVTTIIVCGQFIWFVRLIIKYEKNR